MSYNIRFGGRGREERIAAVVKQAHPDIVIFQEATDTRIVERIAELTQMPHSGAKRKHSGAFISRQAVDDHRWHYHDQLQRALLEVRIGDCSIFGVHLRATHSNYTERGRMREVRAMLDLLKDHRERPHFLVGDFNTLAPGELLNMQKLPTRYKVLAFMLGGRITFRAIQLMMDAGYIDGYRKFHSDPGFTFPAWDPHVRLDYLFTPAKFAERLESCSVMKDISEPAKATDHLPLIAEVSL